MPQSIGRYLVERRLGQGGMADIFLCRQVGMGGFDRLVVVKQVRSDLRVRDDVIHMFLDEARIAAQISHPNVVQIFEIDEAGGLPYLVMEYVKGVSLAALQKAWQERQQLPPLDLIAALGAQVCAGLHAAHELRDQSGQPLAVVHRDISPQNLLLSSHGIVKIIDFGIARAKNRLARTAVGQIKGRLAYLAPELAGSGAIDRRVDLFSLAAVMHELLSGRLLFERSNDIATLGAVLTGDVPSLSELRTEEAAQIAGLEAVLRRALAADPAQRPATAAELGSLLHGVAMATGRYVSAPQVAEYLHELIPDELQALPEHQVPTTTKHVLPPVDPDRESRPGSAVVDRESRPGSAVVDRESRPGSAVGEGQGVDRQTTDKLAEVPEPAPAVELRSAPAVELRGAPLNEQPPTERVQLPPPQTSAQHDLQETEQLQLPRPTSARATWVVDRADQPTSVYQLGQEDTEEFHVSPRRPAWALIAAAAAGSFLVLVLLIAFYLLKN